MGAWGLLVYKGADELERRIRRKESDPDGEVLLLGDGKKKRSSTTSGGAAMPFPAQRIRVVPSQPVVLNPVPYRA